MPAQVQGRTVTTNTNMVRSDGSNSIQNQLYERKRPRNYNLDNSSRNTIKKMKNFKNKNEIQWHIGMTNNYFCCHASVTNVVFNCHAGVTINQFYDPMKTLGSA